MQTTNEFNNQQQIIPKSPENEHAIQIGSDFKLPPIRDRQIAPPELKI